MTEELEICQLSQVIKASTELNKEDLQALDQIGSNHRSKADLATNELL